MNIGIVAFGLDSWGLSVNDIVINWVNSENNKLLINHELYHKYTNFFERDFILKCTNTDLMNNSDIVIVFDGLTAFHLFRTKYSSKILFCPDMLVSGNLSILENEVEQIISNFVPVESRHERVVSFFKKNELLNKIFSIKKNNEIFFDLALVPFKGWDFELKHFFNKNLKLLIPFKIEIESLNLLEENLNEKNMFFYAPFENEEDQKIFLKNCGGVLVNLPLWDFEKDSLNIFNILKISRWNSIPIFLFQAVPFFQKNEIFSYYQDDFLKIKLSFEDEDSANGLTNKVFLYESFKTIS